VNVKGSISDDAIRFVKCNDLTFHSPSSSSLSSHPQQFLQQPHSSQINKGTSPHSMHSSKSSLLVRLSLLEATEMHLLSRMDQVDCPHGELGKAVRATQCSVQSLRVCDAHAPMAPKWQSRRHTHLVFLAHAAHSVSCRRNPGSRARGGKPRVPQDSGLGDLPGTSRHSTAARK
jgi:hypothetical protein